MSAVAGKAAETPALLRQLLAASDEALFAFDLDERLIVWSAGAEAIYGLRADEVLGRRLTEALACMPVTGEEAAARAALAGEAAGPSEFAYWVPETRREGTLVASYTPLRGPDGEVTGGIGVVRDITGKKQAEKRLQETESRFYRMADCSPVLLWMAGTDGLCNFFNQTWLNFTGRSLDQEFGVGWAEGVHPFDFQRCMDTYLDAFNERRSFEMEYRLLRADGQFRWILDRGAPRYSDSGEFAGYIGSCTDITERKTIEDALADALRKSEEASRIKSEFLANISHELRTPLNAIINIPQAVLRDFPVYPLWECSGCRATFQRQEGAPAEAPEGDDNRCPDCGASMALVNRPYFVGDASKTEHFLRRLLQSGQHMLRIINDLLDYTKLGAGRVSLFLDAVDIESVFHEVQQTIGPLGDGASVTLSFERPAAPIVTHADRVKLTQILLNLVGNALKFTPQGSVSVGACVEALQGREHVRIWVKDTGVGIPTDKLETIFESFRQADGSHTRLHQGTGLGLTISRQLAALHGGTVRVESQVGTGSTFSVLLPRDPEPPASQGAAQPSAKATKVLVIDDDKWDLELARQILDRERFAVTLVSQPEAALQAIEELQPDCVILDVMMPNLGGLTLLRKLKEQPASSSIPVVVSTAYYNNSDIVQRLGGIWMPKPWNAEQLLACVRTHTRPARDDL